MKIADFCDYEDLYAGPNSERNEPIVGRLEESEQNTARPSDFFAEDEEMADSQSIGIASGEDRNAEDMDAEPKDAEDDEAEGEDSENDKSWGDSAKGDDSDDDNAGPGNAEGDNAEGDDAKGDDAEGDDAAGDDTAGDDAEGEHAESNQAEGNDAEGDYEEFNDNEASDYEQSDYAESDDDLVIGFDKDVFGKDERLDEDEMENFMPTSPQWRLRLGFNSVFEHIAQQSLRRPEQVVINARQLLEHKRLFDRFRCHGDEFPEAGRGACEESDREESGSGM